MDSLTTTAGETRSDETPVPDEHQRYISLLADLARIMGEFPEIPEPSTIIDGRIRFHVFGDGAPERIAVIRRAIGGKWDKRPRETENGAAFFDYTTEWHGFPVAVVTTRDAVCRRVVVGEREVTEMVKDPEALAAVPEIEVTRTVTDYEWVCEPLLAPRAPEAVPAGSGAAA